MPAGLQLRIVDLPAKAAHNAFSHMPCREPSALEPRLGEAEETHVPVREVVWSPPPAQISFGAAQASLDDGSHLGAAGYRIPVAASCLITAKAAGEPIPLFLSPRLVLPTMAAAASALTVPEALAAELQVQQSNGHFAPIAVPALAQTRLGMPALVVEHVSIPDPAGLMPLRMPEAVPPGVALAAGGEPVSFAVPRLRIPVLRAAPDKLALKAEDAIGEEIFGADIADVPVGAPLASHLGAASMLPALASLFRYGRPAQAAAPLPHMTEGLSPRNRLSLPAAYMELPMPVQRPLVPRSSNLRIVETFEYLRPLEAPPFDLFQSLVRLWRTAPVYFRWAAVTACLILLFWAYVPGGGVARLVESRWSQIQEGIQKRAAVELSEDFQGSMQEWQGAGDWTRSWQKSKAGFVRPGRLALYQPSMQMQEYQVEFLMQVEKRAVSWAYRATDQENYYATKIRIVRPGPLPLLSLVRYPVIEGRAGPRVEVPIRVFMHNDTPYRVQLTVSGDGFSTSIEGQLVDFWRDDSLKTGGFGFFSDTGESARVYWMKLSHQNDFIGRVCAYFRPAPVQGRSSRDTHESKEGISHQTSLEPKRRTAADSTGYSLRASWSFALARQGGLAAPGRQAGGGSG